MVELKVKIIKKWKIWITAVQPFLDKLTEEGYRWKIKGKEIDIKKDGEYVACASRKDWSKNEYWHGIYYMRPMNVAVIGKKMYRIRVELHLSGDVSESDRTKFNRVIAVLKSAREWQPDFKYEF